MSIDDAEHAFRHEIQIVREERRLGDEHIGRVHRHHLGERSPQFASLLVPDVDGYRVTSPRTREPAVYDRGGSTVSRRT
ncbi:MAG TPA: hypothetical protein VMM79_19140 [Longimicrobiales bacterium]|nr:hypothetical protein [Longimicrobiales bacterium]